MFSWSVKLFLCLLFTIKTNGQLIDFVCPRLNCGLKPPQGNEDYKYRCNSDFDCKFPLKCCSSCSYTYKICIEPIEANMDYLKDKYCPKKQPIRTPLLYNPKYRCQSDVSCWFGYKCCEHERYSHKICVLPVDAIGDEVFPTGTATDLTTSTLLPTTTVVSTTSPRKEWSKPIETTLTPTTVKKIYSTITATSTEADTTTVSINITTPEKATTIIAENMSSVTTNTETTTNTLPAVNLTTTTIPAVKETDTIRTTTAALLSSPTHIIPDHSSNIDQPAGHLSSSSTPGPQSSTSSVSKQASTAATTTTSTSFYKSTAGEALTPIYSTTSNKGFSTYNYEISSVSTTTPYSSSIPLSTINQTAATSSVLLETETSFSTKFDLPTDLSNVTTSSFSPQTLSPKSGISTKLDPALSTSSVSNQASTTAATTILTTLKKTTTGTISSTTLSVDKKSSATTKTTKPQETPTASPIILNTTKLASTTTATPLPSDLSTTTQVSSSTDSDKTSHFVTFAPSRPTGWVWGVFETKIKPSTTESLPGFNSFKTEETASTKMRPLITTTAKSDEIIESGSGDGITDEEDYSTTSFTKTSTLIARSTTSTQESSTVEGSGSGDGLTYDDEDDDEDAVYSKTLSTDSKSSSTPSPLFTNKFHTSTTENAISKSLETTIITEEPGSGDEATYNFDDEDIDTSTYKTSDNSSKENSKSSILPTETARTKSLITTVEDGLELENGDKNISSLSTVSTSKGIKASTTNTPSTVDINNNSEDNTFSFTDVSNRELTTFLSTTTTTNTKNQNSSVSSQSDSTESNPVSTSKIINGLDFTTATTTSTSTSTTAELLETSTFTIPQSPIAAVKNSTSSATVGLEDTSNTTKPRETTADRITIFSETLTLDRSTHTPQITSSVHKEDKVTIEDAGIETLEVSDKMSSMPVVGSSTSTMEFFKLSTDLTTKTPHKETFVEGLSSTKTSVIEYSIHEELSKNVSTTIISTGSAKVADNHTQITSKSSPTVSSVDVTTLSLQHKLTTDSAKSFTTKTTEGLSKIEATTITIIKPVTESTINRGSTSEKTTLISKEIDQQASTTASLNAKEKTLPTQNTTSKRATPVIAKNNLSTSPTFVQKTVTETNDEVTTPNLLSEEVSDTANKTKESNEIVKPALESGSDDYEDEDNDDDDEDEDYFDSGNEDVDEDIRRNFTYFGNDLLL